MTDFTTTLTTEASEIEAYFTGLLHGVLGHRVTVHVWSPAWEADEAEWVKLDMDGRGRKFTVETSNGPTPMLVFHRMGGTLPGTREIKAKVGRRLSQACDYAWDY